ncbi:MAG TPA: AAA family ATPase [Terriglobales bacterium]|nr:AAA family ATPase [Terriglobales bacterium]
MPELRIERFGPIQEASIVFRDLTVLVGPQATGKSVVLQLLKLLLDTGYVWEELESYGLDWGRELPDFLDVYFGEGMRSLWRKGESAVVWDGEARDFARLAGRKPRNHDETLFFIPAQRVLALRDGWPRPFTDYASGDPYAVRAFSERLRRFLEREDPDGGKDLFPRPRRMQSEFRGLLEQHVFGKFGLGIDKQRSQKRLVLRPGADKLPLPYMVWSAGQREFVPLLLGLYSIMPASQAPRRGTLRWVVLEELEMGLHPRAISVVLLLVFELLRRGYRVCLSTHSPQVLDAIWAVQQLSRLKANRGALYEVFGVAARSQTMDNVFTALMKKSFGVYYFDPSGRARDISGLDPATELSGESGLGGLSEFSGRASDAVAHAVANADLGVSD